MKIPIVTTLLALTVCAAADPSILDRVLPLLGAWTVLVYALRGQRPPANKRGEDSVTD